MTTNVRKPRVTNAPQTITVQPSIMPLPGVPRILAPRIRSSALTVLQECHRKFMWQYLCGLFPKGEFVSALFVGGLFHEMWATLLQTGDVNQAKSKLAGTIQAHVDGLQKVATAGFLPDGRTLSAVLQKLNTDISLAVGMAEWAWHNAPLPPQFQVVAVEKLLTADLQPFGIPAEADCRVDVLLFIDNPPRLFISDHKTTMQDPNHYASVLQYQTQVQLYRLIVSEALKCQGLAAQLGLPPDTKLVGMSHSVIKKYTIRLKQNETGDDFAKRVVAWYDDDPKGRFIRSTIHWSGPAVTPEIISKLSDAAALINGAQMGANQSLPNIPAAFYRNAGACYGKFGNSPCAYLPLCTSPEHTWPVTIKDKYEFRDPSHKDEDEEEAT